jgi:hypothetical protein
MKEADLDFILDQALDDFEQQEISDQVKSLGEKLDQDEDDSQILQAEEAKKNRDHMEGLLNSIQDPNYGKSLQYTLNSLNETAEG